MFRIIDNEKVYNEVGGLGVPVNVTARRNEYTGEVISYTVEPAGEGVMLPAGGDVATANEVIARFACAEGGYRFPGGEGGVASMTVAELKAKAESMGIDVPSKPTKAKLLELIAEAE